jgi:hypothetical protein
MEFYYIYRLPLFIKCLFSLTAYSPGNKPTFIEADIFKTIIPLTANLTGSNLVADTVTDTVIDTVTDTVSQSLENKFGIAVIGRLYNILSLVYRTPGLRSKMIAIA